MSDNIQVVTKPRQQSSFSAITSRLLTLHRNNIFTLLFLSLISLVSFFVFYEANLRYSRILNYKARALLNQAPKISPKLIVLALDDIAISTIRRTEMSADEWAFVLESLAELKPKAIYIDKIFSLVNTGPESELRLSRAFSLSPTYLASSLSKMPSAWRHPVSSATPGTISPEDARSLNIANLSKLAPTDIYGPIAWASNSVQGVGFISNHHFGQVPRYLKTRDGSIVLPLGMVGYVNVAKDKIKDTSNYNPLFTSNALFNSAQLSVNFPNLSEMYESTLSLADFLKHINTPHTRENHYVKEGDTVLILPLFFTGNADFTDSPIGRIPGGFVHLSLLNSSLTDQWVSFHPIINYITSIAIPVAAIIFSMLLGIELAALATLILVVSSILSGVVLFSFFNIEIFWLGTSANAFLSGLIVLLIRFKSYSTNIKKLNASLGGLFPKQKLNFLVEEIQTLKKSPIERELTVMFIDIAGFSSFSERESAAIVFQKLTLQLDQIARIVHRYGGIVDKSLGDGMLCFFGYDYRGHSIGSNHADMAIDCAIEIQLENIGASMDNYKATQETTLPLRIGLNTGLVFIGDLGGKERIDFTIIGKTVNFAQRLESGCEAHKILLSQETAKFSELIRIGKLPSLERMIAIKHKKNLVKTFEIDPLEHQHDLKNKWRSLKTKISNQRLLREKRFSAKSDSRFVYWLDEARAEKIDFSRNGISMRCPVYFGIGLTLKLCIETSDPAISESLVQRGLDLIQCEVRWAAKSNLKDQYNYGLKFLSLTDAQKNHMFFLFQGKSD